MIGETYCNESGVLHIIYLIKLALSIIRLAIPVILIIIVSLDILKLVISKDVEIGKTMQKIVKRLIAAVLLFVIPSILNFVLAILGNTTNIELSSCWVNATKENIEKLKQQEDEKMKKEEQSRKEGTALSTQERDNLARELRKNLQFHDSTSADDFTSRPLNAEVPFGSCITGSEGKKVGEEIVKKAREYVGILDYKWGGTSLETGADCSGFTQSIYGTMGIKITRTTATQKSDGAPVASLKEAKAGDLILFYGHVGIYNGQGGMIHSPQSGEKVKEVPTIDERTIISIRRIVCS